MTDSSVRKSRFESRARLLAFAHLIPALVVVFGFGSDGSLTTKALGPRSGPREATLFRLMPPEETGIFAENKFDDPAMWGTRYREFLYGAIGTGVAIGDYDNDGRPDLFVVSKTESCRLFRNLGNWKFEDVTVAAGVADDGDAALIWKQGVTFADVNNDGWLDVYLCRFAAPNLLYVNQRDGTFREEAAARGLALIDASVLGAFGDYDRDGWLDVFVVTNALDYNDTIGRPDRLFRNNGDGTFRDDSTAAGILDTRDQGHAAIWTDFNADGWPDLYVTNDFNPPDVMYLNRGDGTFVSVGGVLVPHTPDSSMGADVADLNNDGRLDFLVADMLPRSHEKDLRSMANTRSRSAMFADDPLNAIQLPRNALYLNSGAVFYQEAACLGGLAATDWTWTVRLEDFDNDGRVDAFFTTGMVRELHNSDLRQRLQLVNSLGEQVRLLKASPPLPEANLAFRNRGDLAFEPVGPAWGLDQVGISFGAATGDFDGDGDLDLVTSNYQAGVTVLRNDEDAGHRVMVALRATGSNRFGIGATIRLETNAGSQIRLVQMVRGYASSSEPVAHFGLGGDTHITTLTVAWPSGQTQTLHDLPADRIYVIAEPADTPRTEPSQVPRTREQFVEISRPAGLAYTVSESNFDETRLQPRLPRTFNTCGPAIAVGDLNNDGVDDLCLGGTTQTAPRALLADRRGYFHDAGNFAAGRNSAVNDGPILIFDANGDDRNDVLIVAGGVAAPAGSDDYEPRLFLGEANQDFHRAPDQALPSFRQPVGAAAAADFDRDGMVDVFLGGRVIPGNYPQPARSALWRNLGGTFEEVTEAVAPDLRALGLVTSALWTDVDDDGWLDLLVALEWGPIRFLHNAQGRGFRDHSHEAGFAAAGSGWWTSLAAADFNGDGRPDYVAGNLGLNTPYEATPERPAVLYHGRFAGAATPVLIEARYDDDRLVSRAGHQEFTAVLPSLLKRFPGANDYARASLNELLGATDLNAATRLVATEFRSGVFLSQPDGRFAFRPLPRLAQIAPIQGIVAGDFDGDGDADICALQNSFPWSPAVGRFDGGLGVFLRGDGAGNFETTSPGDHGWVVPGDARALVIVDFDGDAWPDLYVTRSRSPTLAWQNRGQPANRPLEVRLRGRVGNRNAIGARVTLKLSDGSSQTSEVSAGHGVLSQSSAALFFGYAAANPPRRLHIRWPSGENSEHDVAPQARHVTLPLPGL